MFGFVQSLISQNFDEHKKSLCSKVFTFIFVIKFLKKVLFYKLDVL